MSALTGWMRRRALEREAHKLQQRIEARRLAVAAQPVTSVGTWFTGAGLSLASGFMTGVASDIPSDINRDTFFRLLMRASADAVVAAAAFVTTCPPETVDAAKATAVPPPSNDVAAEEAGVTRDDLLQRLRRQSGAP